MISNSVAYCYDKLVKDPSCCLDETYEPDVTRTAIRRPGTQWSCDGKCKDTLRTATRGEDVIWTPAGATCESSRVLYIHGGSWEFGSPDTIGYGQLSSKIAKLSDAVVMGIDYTLVGAGGNFTSIQDWSLAALNWLASHGPEGRECPGVAAPLFVGGDSSGGGTAMSVVMKLQFAPERLPGTYLAGAFFYSPWTNLMCNTPDYYFHAFAKIVDTHSFKDQESGVAYVGDIMFKGHPNQNLDWFTANAEGYVGSNQSLLKDPIASTYYAKADDFYGAPPMYFAVGGQESIMGDSVRVAQKAASAGVDVHLDIYPGMWHVFPMYSEGCGGSARLDQALTSLKNTGEFIKQVSSSSSGRLPYMTIMPAGVSTKRAPFTQVHYDRDVLDVQTAETFDHKAGALAAAAAGPVAGRAAASVARITGVSWPKMVAFAWAFTCGVVCVLAVQSMMSLRRRVHTRKGHLEPLLVS